MSGPGSRSENGGRDTEEFSIAKREKRNGEEEENAVKKHV